MKKKKDPAAKYLYDNKTPVRDVIFTVMIALGLLFFIIVRRFGFIGLPVLVIGVVGYVFTLATKIKDDEFDGIVDDLLKANGVPAGEPDVLFCYDTDREKGIVGRDGKTRCNYICVSKFVFKDDSCEITKYDVDVCGKKVDVSSESFQRYPTLRLDHKKTARFLADAVFDEKDDFPVTVKVNDYDTDVILEKLKQ